jgi:hypothetical protein
MYIITDVSEKLTAAMFRRAHYAPANDNSKIFL